MKTSPSEPTRVSPLFTIPKPDPDREAAWAREMEESQERQRQIKADELWKASGIPQRHAGALKTLPLTGPWADASFGLMDRIGTGCLFVLLGIRGTGKTQMAVKAIHESCRQNRPAAYVKAMQIFLDIRDSFGTERSEKTAVGRYTAPQLLVIDAMEERGETSFEDRILNHIIDMRYDAMKDTILITNQTPQAFSESAGPSIVSRIQETGKKIVCDWPSFRAKLVGGEG